MIRQNNVDFILLVGKSASGKDFFKTVLCDSGLTERVTTTTTRPKRDGEINGREYFFVTKKEFDKKEENGDFLEYREFQTINNKGKKDVWFYGTNKDSFLGENNKTKVIILDPTGIKKVTKFLAENGKKYKVVYIVADNTTRQERAKRRGSFNANEWIRREKVDEQDFVNFEIDFLTKDIIIINNNVEHSKEEIVKLFTTLLQ